MNGDILSFISLSEFICVCSFDLFHRYDEVCRYNFNIHRYQSGLGHFSQLVWKDSEELGIGKYTAGGMAGPAHISWLVTEEVEM